MTIAILRADVWLRTSPRAVPFDAMDNPVEKTPTVSVALLFDQFADGVYTLGYRILGDRHLAEDVVQETFIKVMRSLDTYRGDGPIAASATGRPSPSLAGDGRRRSPPTRCWKPAIARSRVSKMRCSPPN